jgi:ribonuclease P protein component
MLAAKYRIPLAKIPQIMRQGKRLHSDLATLVIWKEALPYPHFAIIVSKKTEPKAVGRNRIKRRVRAIVFELLQAGKFANINYILHIKDAAVKDLPYAEIKQQIENLLTNIENRRDTNVSPK